jgi:hypothetical protein
VDDSPLLPHVLLVDLEILEVLEELLVPAYLSHSIALKGLHALSKG